MHQPVKDEDVCAVNICKPPEEKICKVCSHRPCDLSVKVNTGHNTYQEFFVCDSICQKLFIQKIIHDNNLKLAIHQINKKFAEIEERLNKYLEEELIAEDENE